MNIDKVVFSTSEAFSVCWNLNSKLYKTKLGIEPVCLLFGQKSNTDMSDEYGQIIEMPINPNFPLLIQITWSKFFHPTTELDKTWLIGDIDLFPLQTYWFKDKIKDINENNYVHLDADGIVQLSGSPYKWANKTMDELNPIYQGHATNMPAHYHVAKGQTFKTVLNTIGSFEEEIAHIVRSGSYNGTRAFRESDPINQNNLWCAEELRSTELIRNAVVNRTVNFTGLHLRNGIGHGNGDRIDRSTLKCEESNKEVNSDYKYDETRLKNGEYVDLHAARPFLKYMSQTENVLKLAGMI
jgi:hypothetical protein